MRQEEVDMGGVGGVQFAATPPSPRSMSLAAKPNIICGLIDNLGGIDRAHGRDRGGFVRRHARAEKIGNGNRRDNQDDGDNDQQLDQREACKL